ncbi:uncharacterized protein LOC106639452 [Copidosoma floridanum]|uniref:uncharacterized protein LOC106639452 n=1 Tax=Copidosoma floridanum TaxID=29053 RepID=UPI0006C96209|nr:uncharacterized protein LOC106639452 [Copidosoma floridanum]
MIVILVPFFLAAQLRDSSWPSRAGTETSYRFCVNSTAISAALNYVPDRSTRFNMNAMLRCRFRASSSLLCRMTDAKAVSFASTTVDPTLPGDEIPDTAQNHAEYQIAEEAFEITFTPDGIGKILANRTVSPADLNIIRAVVNQLNVGTNIAKRKDTHFRNMEKSMIGKCDTIYTVTKNLSSTPATPRDPPQRAKGAHCSSNCKINGSSSRTTDNGAWDDSSDYKLSGLESLGRKRGETLRLEKWRNVYKCSLRADYFFGSRESFRTDPTDFEARIVDSESTIYVSDTNFASYTANELHIRRQHGDNLTIYERYSLSLASIDTASPHLPISIVDPASASVYAYQYIDDDDGDESVELRKRSRATRPTNLLAKRRGSASPTL